jgi:hypothetical protein
MEVRGAGEDCGSTFRRLHLFPPSLVSPLHPPLPCVRPCPLPQAGHLISREGPLGLLSGQGRSPAQTADLLAALCSSLPRLARPHAGVRGGEVSIEGLEHQPHSS